MKVKFARFRRKSGWNGDHFHLLTQKYLNSEYSAAEARILYEIYENGRISATEIVSRLHVDKGYLSRILKKFEAAALVTRTASESDSRIVMIALTDTGRALTERLIGESNQQIEEDLSGILEDKLEELSEHMKAILSILEAGHESR